MTSMATFRLTRLRAVIAAGGCHDGHDVLTYKSKLFLSLRQFVRSSNLTHSLFSSDFCFQKVFPCAVSLTCHTSTFEVCHEFLSVFCHLSRLSRHILMKFTRKFFEEKKYISDTNYPFVGSRSTIIGTWTLLGILIGERT